MKMVKDFTDYSLGLMASQRPAGPVGAHAPLAGGVLDRLPGGAQSLREGFPEGPHGRRHLLERRVQLPRDCKPPAERAAVGTFSGPRCTMPSGRRHVHQYRVEAGLFGRPFPFGLSGQVREPPRPQLPRPGLCPGRGAGRIRDAPGFRGAQESPAGGLRGPGPPAPERQPGLPGLPERRADSPVHLRSPGRGILPGRPCRPWRSSRATRAWPGMNLEAAPAEREYVTRQLIPYLGNKRALVPRHLGSCSVP
ncbi:MAG: hypothetical protein MZV70_06150 [Desulfobacterales bacterium]|nr:hypothetical protein [Desulfobacterales bacterium]